MCMNGIKNHISTTEEYYLSSTTMLNTLNNQHVHTYIHHIRTTSILTCICTTDAVCKGDRIGFLCFERSQSWKGGVCFLSDNAIEVVTKIRIIRVIRIMILLLFLLVMNHNGNVLVFAIEV